MTRFSDDLVRGSGYDSAAFATGYDANRPAPPEALLDVLCAYAQVERPALVVDLGAGTGLSTRAWAERAARVVGVELNPEMVALAGRRTSAPNVGYVAGYAHDTGLEAGAADLVTCSQSFHWMEPGPTLAEAARLLRPGGVFCAYDYDWPPVCDPEVDAAFAEFLAASRRLRDERGDRRDPHEKAGHLERISRSGLFRYAREIVLHAADEGSAERLLGMAMSLGPCAVLLREGVEEHQVGLDRLREVAARRLGERRVRWWMSYRARLGVR